MTTSYLIICDRPPYGSASLQESLDMATAAAAFDLPVEVFLRGDAIFGALASQDSSALGQKDVGKLLGALVVYGVTGIYVEETSLAERGLSVDDLVPEVQQILDEGAVQALLDQSEMIIQL